MASSGGKTTLTTSLALFLVLNLVFCCSLATASKPPAAKCPKNVLKLGVCANLLGGLVSLKFGSAVDTPCCTLIRGLADLEAAACLCTAVKANVLGINLKVPINLRLLLNVCGKKIPPRYTCKA